MPEYKLKKKYFVPNMDHSTKKGQETKLSDDDFKHLSNDPRFTIKDAEQYNQFNIIPEWYILRKPKVKNKTIYDRS